jgi:hypothetical protein
MLKFLHQIFLTVKQGFPFAIQGYAQQRFHMGIPVWKRGLVFFNSRMETGIPHFHMGMCESPFPYEDPRTETILAAKIFGKAMALGA